MDMKGTTKSFVIPNISYYNGLCNRKPLFKKIFGFAPNTRYASSVSWKQWEERVEEIFTPIMIAAAKEQGVV